MDTQQKASPEDLIQSSMKTVSSHPWLDPGKAYAGMQAGTPGAGAPAAAAAQAEECVGQLAAALAPWWNNAEKIFIAYL